MKSWKNFVVINDESSGSKYQGYWLFRKSKLLYAKWDSDRATFVFNNHEFISSCTFERFKEIMQVFDDED